MELDYLLLVRSAEMVERQDYSTTEYYQRAAENASNVVIGLDASV